MARLDMQDFTEIPARTSNHRVQDEVPACWSVYEIDGRQYLQIDTYGRDGTNRKENRHPTQVLQLDKDAILRILKIALDHDMLN